MIIERRYNGPPTSGNGGWSAGLVAQLLGSGTAAEVTLRLPPPLATPLSAQPTATGIEVLDPAGAVVARATGFAEEIPPVPAADWAVAQAAAEKFAGFTAHPFPTCFVCGPDRAAGDGLRLFPGWLPDSRTASPWVVPPDISVTMVWASLDCPGGWSVGMDERPYVLGRIAVRVDRVPEPGQRCVVMGVTDTTVGRRSQVRSTLYGPDGAVLASSRATWVEIVR